MKRIPRSTWHTLTICIFLILFWCVPAVASTLDVRVNGARLSLEATDADMTDVLQAVAKKAGIHISVAPGVSGRVTLKLSDVSLEEMLKRLCASRAIVYRYIPESNTYQILQAGAYTSAPGTQAGYTAGAQTVGSAQIQSSPAAGKDGRQKDGIGGFTDDNPTDSRGRLLYKPRELLVQFKAGTTDAQREAMHRTVGSTVLKRLKNLQIDRVTLPEGMPVADALARYAAAPLVRIAERHALRYPLITPNDPYYYIPTDPYHSQWAPAKIRLPEAWDVATGSRRVIIAVIDTGVDYNHPDLAENVIQGWDFAGAEKDVTTDGDADPMDNDGHGTHVAGILAAVGNNAEGVAGVAWNIRIMPLKVQADGATEMLEADIIEAIDYAIEKKSRMVNCSFGGGSPNGLEKAAFEKLLAEGILAVCAAGNDGKNIDPGTINKLYPASYDLDNIIAVAASDQNDGLWSSSNYGSESVHLMAPGVSIYSTWAPGATSRGDCPGASYCNLQGTSMATPHVTGVAALLLSKVPSLSYTQIKAAILSTVDKIDAVATKLISGGRLNAAAALASVRNDGRVDLADAILALQVCSGMMPAPIYKQADVNGDLKIGVEEVIYILQDLSGLRAHPFGTSGWWDLYVPSISSKKIDAYYLTRAGSSLTGMNILHNPITGDISDTTVHLGGFTGTLSGNTITGTVERDGQNYNFSLMESIFHFTKFIPGESLIAGAAQFAWTTSPDAEKYYILVMKDNAAGNCHEVGGCAGIWSKDGIVGTSVNFNSDGNASEQLIPGNNYRVRVYSRTNSQTGMPIWNNPNTFIDTTMDVAFKVKN